MARRYSGTLRIDIRDLRKAGHDIVREHVVGGDRYSLVVAVSTPVAA